MAAHINTDFENSNGPLYWIIWATTFVFSHSAGIIHWVAESVPEIVLPKHDVHYLPQLQEFIPAIILAGSCALVSLLVNKIVNHFWGKAVIYFSSKFKKK